MTAGLFVAWFAMARRPGRWRGFFEQRTWLRVMAWVASLTGAATAGAFVAGESDVAASALALGFAGLLVAFSGWALANTFGPRG